jgi:basic amino acid/polyamine antiporter, APA family
MTARPGEAGLVRALGLWGLTASIVNITIGGGIFRAPGTTEVSGRLGPAAPLAYVVCAVAMAFVVLCFAEAGSRVALTGGPYAYVERAFGRMAGFAVGWNLWVLGTIATAAVGTIFADIVVHMLPSTWVGVRATSLIIVFAVAAIINVLGVRFGARLNIASTIAKLLPLFVVIVLGLTHAHGENLAWHGLPTASNLTRASVFLIFVFAGIESALVPSGEVRDPGRTVPRSVMLALVIVTVTYMLVQLSAQGVLGASLPGRAAPLSDVAESVIGPAGALMVGIGVVVSTFGYIAGMILAVPRALFAFARDGVLPRALATVHPRFHTPWIAILLQATMSLVLGLSSGFEPLVILANVAVLFVFLGCAAAAWRLRRLDVRDAESTTLQPIPGGRIAPVVATVLIIGLLTSVTAREWLVIAIVSAVGVVIWFASAPSRRAAAGVEPA